MAADAYDDYRVTLRPRGDGAFDVSAVGPDGIARTGTFRLPFDDDQFARAVVDVARHGTTRSTATRDVGGSGPPTLDAEQLGGGLAAALLAGDIGAGYDAARRHAASARRGLRLSLSLGEAPQLLSVPWELLYRRPRFLANQRQTPLVRHLDTPDLPPPTAIDTTVRILGVIASPDDCAPLDVGAERARVEQATAAVAAMGRVEIDWLEPATPRRLREALRDGTYHILHYVGHSDFTPAGDGVLHLESAGGGHAEVDSTELANLLSDQTSLRLVVLNSCEGARTTLSDPFAGVATTLVHLGIPAVVAMQFEISDAAAILFAEELYTNLIGRQAPIDAAVGEARKALYIELGGVEWATPVLFMGDVDLDLFRFAAAPTVAPSPPPALEPPAEVGTDEPAPPPRRARRSLVAVAAGVVLLAAAVVVALVMRPGDDDETPAASSVPAGTTTPTVPTGPTSPRSPPIPLGEAARFTGSIDEPDGVVVNPVELAAGQNVYLDGVGGCGPNVQYRLISPSGVQLGGTPYACEDAGRLEIGESGPWTLVVEGFSGGSGPYDVVVEPVPADTVVDVAVGDALRGEITAAGERHQYRFDGVPGQVLYLRGDGPCGASVAYGVASPSGVALSGAPYVCDDAGRLELVESGTHTVIVDSYVGGRGVYELQLIAVPPDTAVDVSVGDVLTGEITVAGERDLYVFDATARQRVGLVGLGPCPVGVSYELLTPSQLTLGGEPYACDDLAVQDLPETGLYTVVVQSYAGGAGTYELQLIAG